METAMKNIQSLLKKTGRTQYGDMSLLDTAPQGKSTKLEFFRLDKYVFDDDLEKEYESRGLVPVSPYEFIQYDLKNRADIDEKKYLATHWKDKEGKWCHITFGRWRGGREVSVGRYGGGWDDGWWFAGLRKPSDIKNSELSDTLPLDLSKAIQIVKEAGYKVIKEM